MSGIVEHGRVWPVDPRRRVRCFEVPLAPCVGFHLPMLGVLPVETAFLHGTNTVGTTTFVHLDDVEPKAVRIRKGTGKLADLIACIVEIRGIQAHAFPDWLEILATPAAKRSIRSDFPPIGVNKCCAFIPSD